MSTPFILVVDDEPDIRNLVREILEDEGYEVDVAENAHQAELAREAREPDLILLDVWMPDTDGITLYKRWHESDPASLPTVIMLSGHATIETAIEATRLGAFDFIEKPLSLAKLLRTVEQALAHGKPQRQKIPLRQHAQKLEEPIGKSSVMQSLRDRLQQLGSHRSNILFIGETGTGRQTLAHYLHQISHDADQPFVEVSATLLNHHPQLKLFGSHDAVGLLEQANGGTLFIKDIEQLNADTQRLLLATLQSHSFQRNGELERIPLHLHIMASCHQSLLQLIKEQGFNEELYYHLSFIPIPIAPLRTHREDVPELLNYYIDFYVTTEALPYRGFSLAAQNRLRNHDWPGNVMELKNLVRELLLQNSDKEIESEEIEALLKAHHYDAPVHLACEEFNLPLKEARERFERAYLEYHLKQVNGSVGKLAQLSGIERTHLYRKLKSLGIDSKKVLSQE